MSRGVGRVVEKFRLWNLADEQDVRDGRVEPIEEACVVDTGATMVVVPPRVVQRLGLRLENEKARVMFANGKTELRDIVVGLRMEIFGRHTEVRALVEPGRDTVLVGQIVLEDMDLLVDCKAQRLVPRDPDIVITEVLASAPGPKVT